MLFYVNCLAKASPARSLLSRDTREMSERPHGCLGEADLRQREQQGPEGHVAGAFREERGGQVPDCDKQGRESGRRIRPAGWGARKDIAFRATSQRKPPEGLLIEVTRSYFSFRNVFFCERGSRGKTSQEAPAVVQTRECDVRQGSWVHFRGRARFPRVY